MPDLFATNIAKLVADGLKQAGNLRPASLEKQTGGDPISCQGFTEVRSVRTGDDRLDEAAVFSSARLVHIVGGSISGDEIPEVNDIVEIDDTRYELQRLVGEDPAQALFSFETKE